MAAYFLDSSAAAKLYIEEVGSSWLRQLIAGPSATTTGLYLARITVVEIMSALWRAGRAGRIASAEVGESARLVRQDAAALFRLLEFSQPVMELALTVAERYALRGYDCVQLATALTARQFWTASGIEPLQFISADEDLNAAAQAEGFTVLDPNEHP